MDYNSVVLYYYLDFMIWWQSKALRFIVLFEMQYKVPTKCRNKKLYLSISQYTMNMCVCIMISISTPV